MVSVKYLAASLIILSSCSLGAAPSRSIWFDKPGEEFTDVSPLGNGRLGASFFGKVDNEIVILNESGMWNGSPQDADRPDAWKALPEIRRLLLEGKNAEAEALVYSNFTCLGRGSGWGSAVNDPYGSYQSLGQLKLINKDETAGQAVVDYRRELFLGDALYRLSYEQGGVHYEREAFVSKPDEAMVLKITADEAAAVSLDILLDRPERAETVSMGQDGLLMWGQLKDGFETDKGVRFASRVRVVPQEGKISSRDGVIRIRDADSVLIYLTAAVKIKSFAGRDVNFAEAAAERDLAGVMAKDYACLLAAHREDYLRLFNRVSLVIGDEAAAESNRAYPTYQRLIRFYDEGVNDLDLAALYFDFGRYLLICSSRPGGFPANLQGIWAERMGTPWNGDWHSNINVQMNYWPAEVCNLSELHQPLFDLIASLVDPGSKTAKAYYNADGWVAFLLQNPWGFTSPGEGADWGSTVSCSAWLCQHLWDHYLYSSDRGFLAWAYPILKGSSRFYMDILIEEPEHGWLVTAPSNSPESAFLLPNGKEAHIAMGPTIDQQLLRYLFGATLEAAKELDVDGDFRAELARVLPRLAPTRVGEDGRVMEWLKPFEEEDPHHRHVSHLWGLYPGNEIHPNTTPELAEAARKTLNVRGDGGTGWSLAHKLNLWARLGDGNRCAALLKELFQPAGREKEGYNHTGGSYPNLWDAHPPFQIDGNFGGTAGIAEMLLQSDEEFIMLLPALPDAWGEGCVSGLRARGGCEVDLSWSEGKLVLARITSVHGTGTQVIYNGDAKDLEIAPGETVELVF